MLLRPFVKISLGTLAVGFLAMSLGCVSKPTKAAIKLPPPAISRPGPVTITPPAEKLPPVLLGIDVLEADKFAAIAGKKSACSPIRLASIAAAKVPSRFSAARLM